MLENTAIAVAAVFVGYLLGGLLKLVSGERWKNSIRGLFVATTAIAVALYFLARNWPK
jgi:hypothetical protein